MSASTDSLHEPISNPIFSSSNSTHGLSEVQLSEACRPQTSTEVTCAKLGVSLEMGCEHTGLFPFCPLHTKANSSLRVLLPCVHVHLMPHVQPFSWELLDHKVCVGQNQVCHSLHHSGWELMGLQQY